MSHISIKSEADKFVSVERYDPRRLKQLRLSMLGNGFTTLVLFVSWVYVFVSSASSLEQMIFPVIVLFAAVCVGLIMFITNYRAFVTESRRKRFVTRAFRLFKEWNAEMHPRQPEHTEFYVDIFGTNPMEVAIMLTQYPEFQNRYRVSSTHIITLKGLPMQDIFADLEHIMTQPDTFGEHNRSLENNLRKSINVPSRVEQSVTDVIKQDGIGG